MKRLTTALFAFMALAVFAACQLADGPTSPRSVAREPNVALASANCDQTYWDALLQEADLLFAQGVNVNSIKGKLDAVRYAACDLGDADSTQVALMALWDFMSKHAELGNLETGVTVDDVQEFLIKVGSAAGLFDGTGQGIIVNPTDPEQTFVFLDGDGKIGGSLTITGQTDVSSTTLIVVQPLPDSNAYLHTDLDQYPRYFRFEQVSADGSDGFLGDVIVTICVKTGAGIPQEVIDRLQLGHQSTDFSVADKPQNATSPCPIEDPGSTRLSSGSSGATSQRLQSGTMPTATSADIISCFEPDCYERGGVSGLADNFSDFGVIDPEIDSRGGVSGLADNFRPIGGATSLHLSGTHDPSTCTDVVTIGGTTYAAADSGTQVAEACRPMVTFMTQVGQNTLEGITATFTVEAGSGRIAAELNGVCQAFDTTPVAVVSDTAGHARVCWELGKSGENKVTMVATTGTGTQGAYFVYNDAGTTENVPNDGDGNGTVDLTGQITFYGWGYVPTTTTLTCPSPDPTYDGQAHGCTAVVTPSGSGTATVTYERAGVATTDLTNAGTITATATYAGDATHLGSSDTKTYTIQPKPASATGGSLTVQFGTYVGTIPCASTSGFLSGDLTSCLTTFNTTPAAGVYPVVPEVTLSVAASNYTITKISGTLTVTGYTQVGCFSSPIYSVMPDTKSAQRKGSNVPVKCTLTWPDGSKVLDGGGTLAVGEVDTYVQGDSVPDGDITKWNTFIPTGTWSVSNKGNYSFGLDTSSDFFLAGKAYKVLAIWKDGSRSVGYFLIKP